MFVTLQLHGHPCRRKDKRRRSTSLSSLPVRDRGRQRIHNGGREKKTDKSAITLLHERDTPRGKKRSRKNSRNLSRTTQMLLKHPIRRTKKLFHKTLQRIKASISRGYQRLPKPPPFNPLSCVDDSKLGNSFRDIESFCNDQWRDAEEEKKMGSQRRKVKIKEESGERMGSARFLNYEGRSCSQRSAQLSIQEVVEAAGSSSRRLRFHACRVVAERLKELERMEVSDVDHVLDVEEVLHYYSRIKCPLYVDLFNKFFLEMFAEMLPQTSSQGNVSCRISNRYS